MEAPLYTVEREFAAPVERLWRAWTDAADLERWYSPVDLSVVPGSVVSRPEASSRPATSPEGITW